MRGGPREETWFYRCDSFGPSGNLTELVPSSAVLHCRYAVDSARPWYGIGPLGWARSTGTLAANLETRLGEEAGASVGSVIPIPSDGGDGSDTDPLAGLKKDLLNARGRTLLAETVSAGWGEGRAAAPQSDYKSQRFGAHPPESLGALRTEAGQSVLSACGVPISLCTDADGTSQRESWRRFVMGSVEPLLAGVAFEIEAKLETRVAFDLSPLWAHDGFSKVGRGGHGARTGSGARGFAGCGSIHRHDLARGLLKSARFRLGPRRKRPKYIIENAAIPAFKSREFLSGQTLAGVTLQEIRYRARVEFKVVSRPQQFFSPVHRVYRLLTEIHIPNRFVFGIVAHRIPLLL